MNPVQSLVNVASLFPALIHLVEAIIGVMGLAIGFRALRDAYFHVLGDDHPGMIPKLAILPILFLSAAAIVMPVIFWRGANTFLLGGDETYNLFAYIQNVNTGSECTNISRSLTLLCMVFGILSLASAVQKAYEVYAEAGRGHKISTALLYFIAGICLLGIQDTTTLLGNTLGVQVGFTSICNAMGSQTDPNQG